VLFFDQFRKGGQRLQTLAIGITLGLLLLLAGLWHIQIVSAKRYRASLETQTYRTVRIPATRGKLLDRDGRVLAENRPSYNLNLYLEELRPQFQEAFTKARAGRRLTRAERAQLAVAVRWLVASNTIDGISRFLGETSTITDRDFGCITTSGPIAPWPFGKTSVPPKLRGSWRTRRTSRGSISRCSRCATIPAARWRGTSSDT